MARDRRRRDDVNEGFEERIIFINRVAKVVKGGKNMGFTALIAVGDKEGRVGVGLGKAREVADAIRKGNEIARINMKSYPVSDGGRTIPHPVEARYEATKIMIKPAAPGTGVIAGGGVRAILEALGIQDAITKVLGSRTAVNVANATIKALDLLEDLNMVANRRGIPIERLRSR